MEVRATRSDPLSFAVPQGRPIEGQGAGRCGLLEAGWTGRPQGGPCRVPGSSLYPNSRMGSRDVLQEESHRSRRAEGRKAEKQSNAKNKEKCVPKLATIRSLAKQSKGVRDSADPIISFGTHCGSHGEEDQRHGVPGFQDVLRPKLRWSTLRH